MRAAGLPTLAISLLFAASSACGEAAAGETEKCEGLKPFVGEGVSVNEARFIAPEDGWNPPSMWRIKPPPVTVGFCRIEGTIEGRIGFEIWLPMGDKWNGRLLGAGVGGDAGFYNYLDLSRGVEAGFAAITNDSGHKMGEKHWMMRENAVADYTHRSQHLMNKAGRAIVAAYYGSGPHHAYFIGCSGGGRQALKEIQLYPEDYDGVVAGAAGPSMPVMSARHLWQALYQERKPQGAMSDADWSVVDEAVIRKCDALDGLRDGVLENPTRCAFDPAELTCPEGETKGCLSAAQVETVKAFYAPLRDEDGRELDSGLVPGVRTRPGPPSPLLLPFFAEGAHRDPKWTTDRFHIRDDLALAKQRMPEMAADNPDLRPFGARGGRAILYQGWLDPSIVAHQSIDYFEKVRKTMGDAETARVVRLYMAPGMLHCRGGQGVDEFGGSIASSPIGDARHDMLSAVVRWVEEGVAPEEIVGARIEGGKIVKQRPLCPYPQEAEYKDGDPARPESYACVQP